MKSIFLISSLIIYLAGCSGQQNQKDENVLQGDFWRKQALKDIIPYWTQHARDTVDGAFITNLDSVWKQFGSTDKYPSMISRHIFSYSVAFLLSGKEKYLDIATETGSFPYGPCMG